MADIEQPDLRGADKRGNVRPSDDRFLSAAQKRKRDAYVTKVEEAKADAEASRDVVEDPLADVLQDAVHRALEPSSTEVTPVTSARGDNDQENNA